MGVSLALINHDELFSSMTGTPVIVNDFDTSSQEDKERLNNLIYTRYEGDSLEVLPTCDCGQVSGEYNVGVRCDNCGSECVAVTERPLESLLWIAAPQGVKTLINPDAWIILSSYLTWNGYNMLEWMTNPSYKIPQDITLKSIKKFREMGLERGINYFYDNFDAIVAMLFERKLFKCDNKDVDGLANFIQRYRDCIFSQHIPIPSKLAFITESTATGIYTDTSMTPAIDAIRTISTLENSLSPVSLRTRQSRAVQAVAKLADYYKTFFKTQLATKYGWFRKHVFGSRLHFSFRAVISSISDNHYYEELHLPWSMSVMLFKAHLSSKLLKRGFTPNEAIKFLYEHTLTHHPLLEELFNELIREAPEGGIPVILQRNPTLTRLSAQRLRVTKIKTDPAINTVSVSVLVLSGMNADKSKCVN